MKFRDKQFTSGEYQYKFLCFVDELVPEAFETLKSLVPKYENVFGAFGYASRMKLFQNLIANNTQKGNYILFNLGDKMQSGDPDAPEPDKNKNPLLKNFLEFRESFYKFIERFGLETNWLKENLFDFLYQLSTNPKYFDGLALAFGYSWNPYEGETVTFEFDGWRIDRDSKDFEKAAKAAFKNHLRDYIKKTAEQAKAHGYKLATGKNALSNVKWLVYWNNSKVEYLWEILPEIPEFEYIDKIKDEQRKKKVQDAASNKLEKAFKEFERFDLPVRPFGNNRKHLTQKKGGNVSGAKK